MLISNLSFSPSLFLTSTTNSLLVLSTSCYSLFALHHQQFESNLSSWLAHCFSFSLEQARNGHEAVATSKDHTARALSILESDLHSFEPPLSFRFRPNILSPSLSFETVLSEWERSSSSSETRRNDWPAETSYLSRVSLSSQAKPRRVTSLAPKRIVSVFCFWDQASQLAQLASSGSGRNLNWHRN